MHLSHAICLAVALSVACANASPDEPAIVPLGNGSFTTRLPPGAKGPPSMIYRTPDLKGPMPTTDWWSSLAWVPFSDSMYAHPLTLRAQPDGLRVWHPSSITANKVGIFALMPADNKSDLVLGHSKISQFPDARVAGFSDWFVTAAFEVDGTGMRTSFGHGSPFVYATYQGGEPVVRFAQPPKVWSGSEGSTALGITIGLQHYGLFAPGGSKWSGLGTATFTCATGGKTYFSLAALPDNRPETLELFHRHAYAHVTGSRVSWNYDPQSAVVTTRFDLATKPMEGTETGTLCALYPHQWRHADAAWSGLSYPCLRGPLRLASGNGFTTRMKFPGILPVLPGLKSADALAIRAFLDEDAAQKTQFAPDTYWDGKQLGRLATSMQIARQTGADSAAMEFRKRLRDRLEGWLCATDSHGSSKTGQLFYHDSNWGTLIGYPASYGSDVDLNDHAFHYGYFLHAAAVLALDDPAWAQGWGPMVGMLLRDIASPDRNDSKFPFLRAFDPYAGHSWASGTAKYFDGNNQESSSEAMNAWAGVTLWGEATGNTRLRDLGAWLFTTELAAIEDYWFDVTGELRPRDYTASVVTMVWGGKSVNETWFSPKPEDKHMINWLPFTGASLYLGRHPAYLRRNYEALRSEVGSENWSTAADLILMYRALDEPADALRQYRTRAAGMVTDSSNSKANLLHWITSLQALGHVDRSITANHTMAAAFQQPGKRTYVACNAKAAQITITFSDGTTLDCPPKSTGVRVRQLDPRP